MFTFGDEDILYPKKGRQKQAQRLNMTLMELPPLALLSNAFLASVSEKPKRSVMSGFTLIRPLLIRSKHKGYVLRYRNTPKTFTSLHHRILKMSVTGRNTDQGCRFPCDKMQQHKKPIPLNKQLLLNLQLPAQNTKETIS
jgi:hypothetical protein